MALHQVRTAGLRSVFRGSQPSVVVLSADERSSLAKRFHPRWLPSEPVAGEVAAGRRRAARSILRRKSCPCRDLHAHGRWRGGPPRWACCGSAVLRTGRMDPQAPQTARPAGAGNVLRLNLLLPATRKAEAGEADTGTAERIRCHERGLDGIGERDLLAWSVCRSGPMADRPPGSTAIADRGRPRDRDSPGCHAAA
jgi:hypothetical protein